jgi:hypothetical protein
LEPTTIGPLIDCNEWVNGPTTSSSLSSAARRGTEEAIVRVAARHPQEDELVVVVLADLAARGERQVVVVGHDDVLGIHHVDVLDRDEREREDAILRARSGLALRILDGEEIDVADLTDEAFRIGGLHVDLVNALEFGGDIEAVGARRPAACASFPTTTRSDPHGQRASSARNEGVRNVGLLSGRRCEGQAAAWLPGSRTGWLTPQSVAEVRRCRGDVQAVQSE